MTASNKPPITHIPTVLGLFSDLFVVGYVLLVLGMLVFTHLTPEFFSNETLLLMFGASVLIPPTIVYFRLQGLKARTQALAAYAQATSYEFYPEELAASVNTVIGSVARIHDARNPHVITAVKGNDWLYYDFTYDLYRRTKNGDYKADRIYYGIMSAELPRELPHIFFDSLKARKQQFRFEFARSQKYSFEGDFDQSFVSYMPDDYKIDTLSFISPEVMLVLKDADDYDIEIVGNHVLLLGPLGDPATQLPDMAAKLAAIKKELVDNIDTYRDERLPYAEGRAMVAQAGAQLRGSSVYFWISVAGAAIAVISVVYSIVANIVNGLNGL